jgi:hypothetical protein
MPAAALTAAWSSVVLEMTSDISTFGLFLKTWEVVTMEVAEHHSAGEFD